MDGKKHGKRRIRYQSRNPYKRRKEEDIRKILDEVDSGISKRAACLKYGLNRKTLEGWIRRIAVRNLAESSSDKLFLSMMDNQQNIALAKKIQELSKALEAANLKIAGLETMIGMDDNPVDKNDPTGGAASGTADPAPQVQQPEDRTEEQSRYEVDDYADNSNPEETIPNNNQEPVQKPKPNTKKKIGSNGQNNSSTPSVDLQHTEVLMKTQNIEVETISTVRIRKGTNPAGIVLSDKTKKPISVNINLPAGGSLNLGMDGSISTGNLISVGGDSKGNFIIGFSIPTGINSQAGINFKISDNVIKNDLLPALGIATTFIAANPEL